MKNAIFILIFTALGLAATLTKTFAGNNITYLDANGKVQTASTTTDLTGGEDQTLTSGWYSVSDKVVYTGMLTMRGDVHLILMDGCDLDVQKGIFVLNGKIYVYDNYTGLYTTRLEGTDSLTIYSQSIGENMGKLTATGNSSSYTEYYGNLYTAGIGGGFAGGPDGGGWSGMITINGGAITATGGKYGAGIGDVGMGSYYDDQKYPFSTITINGGVITATGGSYSAGIGGSCVPASGYGGNHGTITINGGTITAAGNSGGAGIGGGRNDVTHGSYNNNDCGVITITGGTITATGTSGSAGIGGGYGGISGDIIIGGTAIIEAHGGNNNSGNAAGSGIGTGDRCRNGTPKITISGEALIEAYGGEGGGAGIGGGLCEGRKITINGNPQIKAYGKDGGAGIGGCKGFIYGYSSFFISGNDSGEIYISGGTIEANGGAGVSGGGAGIGGGAGNNYLVRERDQAGGASFITITGSANVTAIGGDGIDITGGGAGLGCGGAQYDDALRQLSKNVILSTEINAVGGAGGSNGGGAGASIGMAGGDVSTGKEWNSRTITATTDAGGRLSLIAGANESERLPSSCEVQVSYDSRSTFKSEVTFYAIPDADLRVADVLIDGNSVGAVDSYTFTDVTDNHTIHVKWKTVTAIETIAAQSGASLKIYSNPVVNGEIRIDNEGLKAGQRIGIYTLTGILVISGEISGENVTVINVSRLPQGMYLVKAGERAAKVMVR